MPAWLPCACAVQAQPLTESSVTLDLLMGHWMACNCEVSRVPLHLEGAQLVVGAVAEDDHAHVGREVRLPQRGEELGEEVGEAADLGQARAHQHHALLCAGHTSCRPLGMRAARTLINGQVRCDAVVKRWPDLRSSGLHKVQFAKQDPVQ